MSALRNVVEIRAWLQQPGRLQPAVPAQRWQRDLALSSGFAALDAALPWGGWPRGMLTEIMVTQPASAELTLLLPALRSGWSALVGPPLIPYPPALQQQGLNLDTVWLVDCRSAKERLWAFEALLKSGGLRCIVAWQMPLNMAQSRRLQLAAEAGECCAFLIRPEHCRGEVSAAGLRLQLTVHDAGVQLELFKCRGQVRSRQIDIAFDEVAL